MANLNRRRRVVQDARPIPRSVWSALGPVPVRLVVQPMAGENGDRKAFGTFDIEQRAIDVQKDMSRATTRQVFLHEVIHLALWDAGVQLAGDQEEAVCTALATYLVASRLVRQDDH